MIKKNEIQKFFWAFIFLLCINLNASHSMKTINKKQKVLLEFYQKTLTEFNKIRTTLLPAPVQWERRKKEVAELLDKMSVPQFVPAKTNAGPALIWQKRMRKETFPLQAISAQTYMSGPNNAVVPSTGEFTDRAIDLAGFARQNIGIELERFYSSAAQYDCGFGWGWDFCYNVGVVSDGEDLDKLKHLTVFVGNRNIVFTYDGQKWVPESGIFLRIQFVGNQLYIYTSDLQRYEFELAKEQNEENLRWRLTAIASRHDQFRANRMTFSYLPDCDRLASITGPLEDKVFFVYDKTGHIVQVYNNRAYVNYAYEKRNGKYFLSNVEYSPDQHALIGNGISPKISYQYALLPGAPLIEKSSSELKYVVAVKYDIDGRVIEAGFSAADKKQMWSFKYPNKKQTVVYSPEPTPETHYIFDGTPHFSLPSSISIPAQNAKWQYKFNDDYLLSEITYPLGNKEFREYDSLNKNILAHGNLLLKKSIPAKNLPSELGCIGQRYAYHEKISLPTKIEYYQVDKQRKETVLKTEIFEYSADDFMMTCHDDGGIKTYNAYNRFGLPVLEWDANKNVTISYYAKKFPARYSFEFENGDITNGGPLVCTVRDAAIAEIKTAVQAIGHNPIVRDEVLRINPCALRIRTAYDPYGNVIHTRGGDDETFYIYSNRGKLLLSCDAAFGIKEYKYFTSGKTNRIYHEFCPTEKNKFRGYPFLFFANSRYYVESFQYDSLDMLTAHYLTDEKFEGKKPVFRYHRYPNGKVKQFTNPVDVSRFDQYDLQTGFLQKQVLKGGKTEVTLTSDYQYYPTGIVKSYVDQFGGQHTSKLDGFSRIVEYTDPQGVISVQKKDGLERLVTTSRIYDGAKLSCNEFTYSSKNQKIKAKTLWKIDKTKQAALKGAEFCYDDAGNLIGKRGVREGSWQYFLVDGCGNTVASVDSENNISVNIIQNGKTVFSIFYMKTNDGWTSIGKYAQYDFAGRLVRTVPVDCKFKLKDSRAEKYFYDTIGRRTRTISMKLTSTELFYDTLGNILTEEIKPLNADFGELPIVTHQQYRADGQILKKILKNEALALYGSLKNVKPELVSAPQITEWSYDELGRLYKTIQPDGLIAIKKYNQYSMPDELIWSHLADPKNILRHLQLRHNNCGKVTQIKDNLANGQNLRSYSYDKNGNCIELLDSTVQKNPISLKREFDSLGNMISEKVEYNGFSLPSSTFEYDPVAGKYDSVWENFYGNELHWRRETRQTGLNSNVKSLSLDGKRFVTWDYLGNLPYKRGTDHITSETKFNSLLEPIETSICDQNGELVGKQSYDYGAQGQLIFSSSTIMKGYKFSTYSQFDAYRRLVGQNGEAIVPADINEIRNRYKQIFGINAVASINTSRMVYDQANNIWGRYSGTQINGHILSNLKNTKKTPKFVSAAQVIPAGNGIPDLLMRELASNRETTTAAYSADRNLEATELKYDHLGNLIEYNGSFWNGIRRYPVKWDLTYDALGRLVKMSAEATETQGFVKKGKDVAEMTFLYDAENRRLQKTVKDFTRLEKPLIWHEITLYRGTQQTLIYRIGDNNDLMLVGEYLWGNAERELLMAILPENRVENNGNFRNSRYYFQQDKNLNNIFTSKVDEDGDLLLVAAESYLGFGDNSTFAEIKDIKSSMEGKQKNLSYNRALDEKHDAQWSNPGKWQYMELELAQKNKLAQLVIWTNSFPKNFYIFVLPKDEEMPLKNIEKWVENEKNQKEYLAAFIRDNKINGHGQIRGKALTAPYRIPLRELEGNRILLVFEDSIDIISVREFEVIKVEDNPSAIAFAGQWLDRETNMYYQINRYRLAGSSKFISPDPIGFIDGNNLYAYAKANPLEWHDPDGRWAHIVFGAVGGALINSGVYAVQCWITGEEFSWKELAIQAGTGALAGGIAAATFGAVNPLLAGWGFNATANIITSAATAGFTSGFASGATDTLLHGGGAVDALKNGLTSGAWGAAAGAIGGGVLSYTGASFGGTVLSGAVAGGIVNSARSAWDAYSETGDWSEAGWAALDGLWKGSVTGAVIAGSSWGIGRVTGRILPLRGYPEHMTDPREKGILIRTKTGAREYGGLPAKPGYQRQHIKPLSLGGRDVPSNIEYMKTELHSTNPALGGGPQNAHPGAYVNSKPMGTIFY